MEQAAKRQDRGDVWEKQHGAPAGGGGAEPEEPFSLLQELPAPLMRQLVLRHLDAEDCLALLRTSHALARAAVQHRTHQQRRALTWAWEARKLELSSMDASEASTAASLLVRWAPAELSVKLLSTWTDARCTSDLSLPAALLPLITSLRLHKMHLTPAAMDGLQQCQRLHTLDVDQCSFAGAPNPKPPARPLQALPLLRTFRYSFQYVAAQPWAVRDLGALCALATDVATTHHVAEWVPHFTHATRWDVHGYLDSRTLRALLPLPNLRHVQSVNLALHQDHRQQQCQWEALEVQRVDGVHQLLLLPTAIGRMTVQERLALRDVDHQQAAAVLQRWGALGRLQARVDAPPPALQAEFWCLGAEEARQSPFFSLCVEGQGAVAAHAPLLRSMVLPQGGGPHTLEISLFDGHHLPPVVQQLATLLAGTRVRTLCMGALPHMRGPLGGVLSALPASIACVRLAVCSVGKAIEVVVGPAATHPLRLVVLLPCGAGGAEAGGVEEARELRELCAARQPLVLLEVMRRGRR